MMRVALVLVFACGSHTPPPVAHAHGVHGMVVFGHDHLFASHLPLYHAPHDWQVILEVAPDAVVAAKWRAELGDAPLVTFEPEPFDLIRLAPDAADPLREVAGTVYRGHFERGGTAWQKVRLRVERVLLFRKVDPHAATAKSDYFAFGDGAESYLVHAIGARPDVDEIYATTAPPPAGAAAPVTADAAALAAARLVYRETDDLAE
jgi:hypothetical protein